MILLLVLSLCHSRSSLIPPPRSTSHEHTSDLGPEENEDILKNQRNINSEPNTTLAFAARKEVLSSSVSSSSHITADKAPLMYSPTAQSEDQESIGSHLPQALVPGRLIPRSATSSNADLLEQVSSQVTQEHPLAPLPHHLFNNDATTAALFNNSLQEEDTSLELPQEGCYLLPHSPLFTSPRYSVNGY